MIFPDSSVLIAAFAPWNTAHVAALRALQGADAQLIAHAAFETVSVLSRLPEGQRIAAPLVVDGLIANFPRPWLALTGTQARAALERAISAGLRGGALYDALIAATAARHAGRLLSADQRARRTYEALEADVTYVAATPSA